MVSGEDVIDNTVHDFKHQHGNRDYGPSGGLLSPGRR